VCERDDLPGTVFGEQGVHLVAGVVDPLPHLVGGLLGLLHLVEGGVAGV
jgi:hypothetical protein